MSHPQPPTSSTPAHLRPVNITIPATWTPEQALAIFELIDELREKIFALYGSPIQDLLREQQGCFDFYEGDAPPTDRSF